jgi:hypothetical protein
VLDERKTNLWLLWGLAVLGLAYAVYSSLPVLDLSSALFNNDEGLFLHNGQRGVIPADVRYGLFSLLVRGYFVGINDPFWVVVGHKSLSLAAFLSFQPMLVRKYGNKVFMLLFLAFTFLNGYFLRDSLVFLFVLLAVTHTCTSYSIRRYPVMMALALTRPQGILLFLRPCLSVFLLLFFLLFMRGLYSVEQIRDSGYLSLFSGAFWKDIGSFSFTTLANLNPLASLSAYTSKGEYIALILMALGSISMFAVFVQMGLGLRLQQYRKAYFSRLWMGMLSLLIIYGSIGLAIDKRIFFSLFAPFIIFVNPSLLRWRNLILLVGAWVFMLLIHMNIKNAA